jgi:hypothetical protein
LTRKTFSSEARMKAPATRYLLGECSELFDVLVHC